MKIDAKKRESMKTSKGFTLIEVLIVIALLGILSAIAVPLASESVGRSRLNAASRELYADLQGLRRDAMTRISAPNGRGYGIRFISATRYELFEFNDLNNDYEYNPGAGEESDPEQRDLPPGLAISLGSGANPSGAVILFDKRGFSRGADWGIASNTFLVRKSGEVQGRCLRIALSRIREGAWNGSDCGTF